jgi:receptor protein-tyrosine kinase
MIGVLGVHQGAGTSTIALALAVTAVHDFGLKTILVDGNSANGELSRRWGKKGNAGLQELVEGETAPIDCIQPLDETGVSFVSIGAESQATTTKSAGWKGRLAAMMQLKYHGELVVIDLSSAETMSQAAVLASKLDGVVVVAESGKTESVSAEATLERLQTGGANVYGIVMNKMKNSVPRWLANLLGIQS